MPSLNTTTVSINKENTKALRELVKANNNKVSLGAMVNAIIAEKLRADKAHNAQPDNKRPIF